MTTKYVIREQSFRYSDEHYYPCSGDAVYDNPRVRILQVFDDEVSARHAYRKVLIASLREPDPHLYKFECELLQEFEELILEKLGEQYSSVLFETHKPPVNLSDDDLLEFAYRTGWLPYVLVGFEHTQPINVVWITKQQKYLMIDVQQHEYDYHSLVLVGEDYTPLSLELLEIGFHHSISTTPLSFINKYFSLQGTPEQLSYSPELLRKLLSTPNTGIDYNSSQNTIRFYDNNDWQLFWKYMHTLNSLLKQPLYEIHPIDTDQIKGIIDDPTVRIA
jgi:hypothetical protein